MDEYIRNAIIKGIFETLQMTFFSSLFAYAIGLPLGILLYTTSKGRIFENRFINTVVGAIVNISRSDSCNKIHCRCFNRNYSYNRAAYNRCYSYRCTYGRVVVK